MGFSLLSWQGTEVADGRFDRACSFAAWRYPDALTQVNVEAAIAAAEGVHDHALTWSADGTSTELSIQVTRAGLMERVEFVSTNTSGDLDVGSTRCPTVLSWAADVEVRTTDGRLDEVFSGTMSTHETSISYLEHLVDAPNGTIDPRALASFGASVDADVIRINARINAGTTPFSGAIAPAPAGDLWGDVTPLASWPEEQQEETE